jgi:hypothetical protein
MAAFALMSTAQGLLAPCPEADVHRFGNTVSAEPTQATEVRR